MYDAKANRNYYLSQGRCPRCSGRNFVEPGKCECRECSLKESEKLRELRLIRRENGQCTRCGKILEDGTKYVQCAECRKYNAAFFKFNRERYYGLKEAGMCVKCGAPAEPGKTMCRKCLDAHVQYAQKFKDELRETKRKRRAERIEAGLCIDCGKPVGDNEHTRCKRCREMRMDSVRKYRITKRIQKQADEARRMNHV